MAEENNKDLPIKPLEEFLQILVNIVCNETKKVDKKLMENIHAFEENIRHNRAEDEDNLSDQYLQSITKTYPGCNYNESKKVITLIKKRITFLRTPINTLESFFNRDRTFIPKKEITDTESIVSNDRGITDTESTDTSSITSTDIGPTKKKNKGVFSNFRKTLKKSLMPKSLMSKSIVPVDDDDEDLYDVYKGGKLTLPISLSRFMKKFAKSKRVTKKKRAAKKTKRKVSKKSKKPKSRKQRK